jgi:hypothetical protein
MFKFITILHSLSNVSDFFLKTALDIFLALDRALNIASVEHLWRLMIDGAEGEDSCFRAHYAPGL